MNLPNDPAILLSYVNTLLRDKYESLGMLCEDMQINETELRDKLSAIGYSYNEKQNQFK